MTDLSPAAHAVVGAAHAVDWVNRRALAAGASDIAEYPSIVWQMMLPILQAPYSTSIPRLILPLARGLLKPKNRVPLSQMLSSARQSFLVKS